MISNLKVNRKFQNVEFFDTVNSYDKVKNIESNFNLNKEKDNLPNYQSHKSNSLVHNNTFNYNSSSSINNNENNNLNEYKLSYSNNNDIKNNKIDRSQTSLNLSNDYDSKIERVNMDDLKSMIDHQNTFKIHQEESLNKP